MIKKLLKIAGWAIVSLVGLVVAVFLVLKAVPDEKYNAWITDAVKSATGRDFSMENLAFDFGSSVAVSADGVRMANAEWGSTDDMLTVGHLEAEIKLLSLLGGVADIRLVTQDVDVQVESSAEGESNWALGSGEPEEEEVDEDEDGTMELPVEPMLREIRLEDIVVNLVTTPGDAARNVTLNRLLIETPEEDTTLSLSAQVQGVPIELSGNLGDISAVLQEEANPLRLGGRIEDNTLDIAGEWGPMYPQANMQLALTVDAPSTARLAEMAGLSMSELGVLGIEVELVATDGEFAISRLATELDGDVAHASVTGSIGNLLAMKQMDITTEANTAYLNRLLQQFDVNLPLLLPPDVEVSVHVTGSLDPLGVENFHTAIHDEGLEMVVNGTVEDAINLKGVDGSFEVSAASTATLSKYADMPVPDLGAISITGKVQSADETLQLVDLVATISSDNISFSVTGGVADLVNTQGISLALASDISSFSEQNIAEIQQLLDSLEIEAPLEFLPQSVALSANAAGDLEQLAISDIVANVLDGGLEVSLNGSIENAITVQGVAAEATVNADGTALFSKYAGAEVPEFGPVDVNAKVASSEDSYSLESLDARVGTDAFNVSLAASITDILSLSGVSATVDGSLQSLSALSDAAGTTLPETPPLSLHAELAGSKGDENSPVKFVVDIDSGSIEVDIGGSMADLATPDDIQLSMAVKADSIAEIGQFAQTELADKGPLALSGKVSVKPGAYALDDFNLKLAEQHAFGNVAVAMGEEGGLASVSGQLNIPYIDLSDFIASDGSVDSAATAAAQQEGEVDEETEKTVRESTESDDLDEVASDRMFPTDPLPFEQLRLIDVDFDIQADRLVMGKMDTRDFNIHVSMQDGVLDINPIKGISGDGTIDGQIHLDASKDNAELDAKIVIDALPMPNLGGEFDLGIGLTGSGQSVADMLGTANGKVLLVLQDGIITHSFATNFGSGLFSFSGDKDETELECGILKMDITDGLAVFDKTLVAQLTDVTWRGGGEINLKTEKLGVGIEPKPRKGIGISIAGLASLVYVGGSLKSPSVKLNPTGVAKTYGKYWAYVATGGLSLVAEALHNKMTAGEDLCAEILAGTIFEEQAPQE